jgi:hypothetical protein
VRQRTVCLVELLGGRVIAPSHLHLLHRVVKRHGYAASAGSARQSRPGPAFKEELAPSDLLARLAGWPSSHFGLREDFLALNGYLTYRRVATLGRIRSIGASVAAFVGV